MNKSLASFVCVTYKRPTLLNELLYCFLAQDYENKELIIINDEENVDYFYNDSRVKIFNIKKRFASLGEKRNFSRGLTNGDFMFITDDDDIYYSNHISSLLKHHLNNPEFDIVCNKKAHYSEWNENISECGISVASNGACIKKDYWSNNSFPNDKSCGEDQEFIQNAKILSVSDDITYHIRWGFNIYHISGLGGDGRASYEEAGMIENRKYLEKITLTPVLSKQTSKYYK